MGPAFRSRSCRNLFHRASPYCTGPAKSNKSRFSGLFRSRALGKTREERLSTPWKRLQGTCSWLQICPSNGRLRCHPEPPEALEREARNAEGRSKDPFVLPHSGTAARPGYQERGPSTVLRCSGFAYAASAAQDDSHRSAFRSASSLSKSSRYPSATSASVSF